MIGIVVFVLAVALGTIIINTFIFRSFSVVGPSMEATMFTGDRLIVDRLPVTAASLQGQPYVPKRGQVIVFKNPHPAYGTTSGTGEYIVKRVIAFAGERVVLKNGVITVYNRQHTSGFRPDDDNHGEPKQPTSGEVDMTVPKGELFVAGDNRINDYSYDSRSGLGTIPYYDIVGPVSFRFWPFDKMRRF